VEHMTTARSTNGRPGLSPRTRQVAVAVLKMATAWANATGMIPSDPLVAYKRPKLSRPAATWWGAENAATFLDFVRGDRLEAIWALVLLRGLRRGEACGLRWTDIDLREGTIRIERALLSVNGRAVESDVKTDTGRRTVPIDPGLVTLLRAHDRRQKEERLAGGEAWQGTGHVVANELGEPYHPDALAKRFQVLVKASGLPRIRFHDLRHSCASLLLARGVQPKVVAELLGHASVQITLALYGHVSPSMARDAGAELSASLLGDRRERR